MPPASSACAPRPGSVTTLPHGLPPHPPATRVAWSTRCQAPPARRRGHGAWQRQGVARRSTAGAQVRGGPQGLCCRDGAPTPPAPSPGQHGARPASGPPPAVGHGACCTCRASAWPCRPPTPRVPRRPAMTRHGRHGRPCHGARLQHPCRPGMMALLAGGDAWHRPPATPREDAEGAPAAAAHRTGGTLARDNTPRGLGPPLLSAASRPGTRYYAHDLQPTPRHA